MHTHTIEQTHKCKFTSLTFTSSPNITNLPLKQSCASAAFIPPPKHTSTRVYCERNEDKYATLGQHRPAQILSHYVELINIKQISKT